MAGFDYRELQMPQLNLNGLALATDAMNKGFDAINKGVNVVGDDYRKQQTNNALAQIGAMQNSNMLANGQNNILAHLAEQGNGIDGNAVVQAMNQRKQDLINQEHQQTLFQQQQGDRTNKQLASRAIADARITGNPLNTAGITDFTDVNNYLEQKQNEQFKQTQLNLQGRQIDNEKAHNERQDSISQQNANTNELGTTSQIAKTIADGQSTGTTLNADGSTTIQTNNNVLSAFQAIYGNDKTARTNSLARAVQGKPYAHAYGNDPQMLAMGAIENPNANMSASYNGSSVGPMQLNRKYAQSLAKKYGIEGDPLTDPEANIKTGQAYLKDLQSKFGVRGGAIAYNAGPTAYSNALAKWDQAGKKGDVTDYIAGEATRKEAKNHGERYMQELGKLQNASNSLANIQPSPTFSTATSPSPLENVNSSDSDTDNMENVNVANAIKKAGADIKGNIDLGDLSRSRTLYHNELSASHNAKGGLDKKPSEAEKSQYDDYLRQNGFITKNKGALFPDFASSKSRAYDAISNMPEYAKWSIEEKKSILDYVGKKANDRSYFSGDLPPTKLQALAKEAIGISSKETKNKLLETSNEIFIKQAKELAQQQSEKGNPMSIESAAYFLNPKEYLRIFKKQTN